MVSSRVGGDTAFEDVDGDDDDDHDYGDIADDDGGDR